MSHDAAPGEVAVLIPARDEEAALPLLFDALPEGVAGRIVVVDNGSSDRTADVARARGATVLRDDERGYGAACLTGIRHLASSDSPPTALAFVDADAVAEAPSLPRLVAPILEGRADLVLGVREGRGGHRGNLHLHARFGNRLVLWLAGLLFGVGTPDLPPFRAIHFESLRALEMDDRSWGWTLQMQIRARRKGLRVARIVVPHERRPAGRSKISGSLSTSIRVGAKMLYTLVRERMR